MLPTSTACLFLLGLTSIAAAAGDPQWLRSPQLSPDGKQIVFRHRGDLWLVGANGGEAQPLVRHAAFDGSPVWSPDGATIAFASDRDGSLDVYIVPSAGGEPQRLTFHSGDDTPTAFSADGKRVIFAAARHDTTVPLRYPYEGMPGTYQVAVEGGPAVTVLAAPAEQASPAADANRWLYAERKGGEMEWRKHERSPATWDLWLFDAAQGRHRRLTAGDWQYREPVWSPAGDALYYLSEQDGTFNVWRMPLSGEAQAVQLTRHVEHPVRSLSVSAAGDLCYGQDGRIFLLPTGAAAAREIAVSFANAAAKTAGTSDRVLSSTEPTHALTGFAVAPGSGRIAFVARGELFIGTAGGKGIRRLTETAAAEAGPSFSPDGRSLAYASERDGLWQIYSTTLAVRGTTEGSSRRVFESALPSWQPHYSPDGRWLAFVEDGGLAVRDLQSGSMRTLLPRFSGFTRGDGNGHDMRWHPDSQHLAIEFLDLDRPGTKVGYLPIDGGPVQTVSLNAYHNLQPRWSPSGGSLGWMSDSQGLRDYGSVSVGSAVFAAPLRAGAAVELGALTATERAARDNLLVPWPAGVTSSAGLTPPSQPVAREALTRLSTEGDGSQIQAFEFSADGSVIWASSSPAGFAVWHKAPYKAAKWLGTLPGKEVQQLQLAGNGRDALVLIDGTLHAVSVRGGTRELIGHQRVPVDEAAERAAQVTYAGNHALRAFFRPDMDRAQWLRYVARYRQLAPQAVTRREFRELLNELVGELNASHTAAYDARDQDEDPQETSALGAVLEPAGEGYRIAYIAPGSPLAAGANPIATASVLLAIDGHAVAAQDWNRWLNGKAGKPVELELAEPASGRRWKQKVLPLSQADNQQRFYRAWVHERRERVRRESGGRLAYAHLEWMEEQDFRNLYNDAMGQAAGAAALIVDTRYNGGGWLHESLLPFLQGRFFFTFTIQGHVRSSHPEHAWPKPSVMLINSANYSNASEIPHIYQAQGIGRLVGAPIAGTGLGGAHVPLGNAMEVSIANEACYDAAGRPFEGTVIEPDIAVEETPEDRAAGRDPQLERAMAVAGGR